jgi:hypothetical protein
MTALNLSTGIPSNINTYERLLVWAAQCCVSISNGQQVNVTANEPGVPLVQVAVGVTADNVDRLIVSAYLPVDYAALNSGTQKTWMATKDISAAAVHTNLTTN